MFSSIIFLVSGLVFKSNPLLADFFVQYRIAVQFHFFFFASDYLVYPTLFIEKTIFYLLYFWHLCQKIIDHICRGLFVSFLCYFLSLCVYMMYVTFMLLSCCFDYCSFVIQLEIRRCNTFSFVFVFFFFHDYFGYSGSFVDPKQILGLFYFCEKCH